MRTTDPMNPAGWDPDVTEEDEAVFRRVTSTDLSAATLSGANATRGFIASCWA